MLVILKTNIEFFDWDHTLINLSAGTEVYVDIDESIAFKDGIHFDIEPQEYSLFH